MPTSVILGLGKATIGTGILQGEASISERVETLRLGTEIPLVEQAELVTSRRTSISFATSDIAVGLSLVNGDQTPTAVGFSAPGGLSYSVSGVLTSAEYSFSVGGISVCRLTFDGINSTLGSTGGGSVSAANVGLGLGTVSAGGTLVQSVSISASAEFLEQMGGTPAVLKERVVKRASVRMTASFAEFGSVTVGASPADVTFTHNNGVSFTVSDAVLKSVERKFSVSGMALQVCEWVGTGLTVA